eukprot:gene4021-4570_t
MTLKRNFYVDDMLKSKECSSSSIALISNVCASGGFNLTKFASNDKEVLESIPQDARSKEVKKCDLAVDNLPAERALGVYWCVENDTLGFRIELNDKPLTRRGVLSSISSIYDPLGVAAPFLLQGRKILQQLCSDKKEWDDDLSEDQKNMWLRWRQELPLLETLEITRCYKPKHFEEAFEIELKVLKNVSRDKDEILRGERRILKKASSLFKLDPFLDENGIVRVGGRMKKSCFDEECKHPILLPKKGKVTELVIDLCHRKAQHAGRGMTLNEIRSSGYWIINANSKVRQFISRCVRCRSLRRKLGEQKMADLPEERVKEAPPFTYCGVDLFGPFVIKERRKELKRYGVLFTCFGSCVIHIETTNSLDTDSFIQALRRFIARRGSVRQIYSDNGTNFVGTVNELQKEFEKMDQSKISRFADNQNTDWIL